MARIPRIVIPGYPHHVTQRGNHFARTFFEDGDFATFLSQEEVTEAFKRLRQSETTGRPLGSEDWIEKLTAMTGRELKAKKRDRKRK